MAYSLTWLPRVLESAGLKVALEPGWEKRGRAEMGRVLGVMCHHTGHPSLKNMPTLKTLRDGRPDLIGPLSQLGLARDGTFYVIAAGRCNHAGAGRYRDIKYGNSSFIGIEAENRGTPNDRWPSEQMRAYVHGVAAILRHLGRGVEFCIGHKEWAPTRKVDPLFDMHAFRAQVAQVLNGSGVPLPMIPAAEPPSAGGLPGRPTLRRGVRHALVREVQRKLGLAPDGDFGPATEALVREFQRGRGLVPDGIVGPRAWRALDGVEVPAGPPLIAVSGTMAWGSKVSPAFKAEVIRIAARIGCQPDDLMACMAFETGESFSPSVRNKVSGATGLIQFMPKTAASLKTTTARLAGMTAEEQLHYVEAYFAWWPPVQTLEDVYMAILWPRAIGKPNDYVLFAAPEKAYVQNRGLDADRDGRVTKAEAAAKVRTKLERGRLHFLG